MYKLIRVATAAAVSAGLTTGLASGIASAQGGFIDTTGPNSTNTIRERNERRLDIDNRNDIRLRNTNWQRATTGDAEVRNNTFGGDAWTGDASNDNSFDATVDIDNSSTSGFSGFDGFSHGDGGTIHFTGPNSHNRIDTRNTTRVDIDNRNDVNISNHNDQIAESGDATVRNNTEGGSAVTGDAENTNSASFDISISN